MVREIPKSGEFYKHFKDKLYQVITVAEHTETQERLVVYQALYGSFSVYARPLSMFMSEVDTEKHPDVTQKYRFTKVEFVTKTKEDTKVCTGQIMESGAKAGAEQWSDPPNSIDHSFKKEDMVQEQKGKGTRNLKRQYSVEELFCQFLDVDTYKEKLEIFLNMKDKVDDKILTNIAVSLDIVAEDDDLEERYTIIRQNLETYAKFECNRLR